MVNTATIREHMPVIARCGKTLGKVDRLEEMSIKLTKDTEGARGEHRYIPLDWVERIDDAVHLKKISEDVQEQWQAHPVEEGEYPAETAK